uniref:Uncharacterized protein n=1 Tax=Solanum tuberosum TaxID=4113 RepID=M1BB32_SOLTU
MATLIAQSNRTWKTDGQCRLAMKEAKDGSPTCSARCDLFIPMEFQAKNWTIIN